MSSLYGGKGGGGGYQNTVPAFSLSHARSRVSPALSRPSVLCTVSFSVP